MMLSLVCGTDFQGSLGLSGARTAFYSNEVTLSGHLMGADHQNDYTRKGSLSLIPHPEG